MPVSFSLLATDPHSHARRGQLRTDHGIIETPVFMPVGTYGAVKTLAPWELETLDARIILGNTYHLYLRPGTDVINRAHGLHGFADWSRSLLTDSGGFQVFSLAKTSKIDEDGVHFQSHLDGSKHYLTPELSMEIQRNLGADIIMAFDQCPPGDGDESVIRDAVRRTARWIRRCADYLDSHSLLYEWDQVLFPIVQGGISPELRNQSAEDMLPFARCGVAIGGLAVGEPKPAMVEMLELLHPVLPREQPRYLMGVGTPADLVEAVLRGVDMFDCVMPTRNARNGQLFTSRGKLNILNARHRAAFDPVDPDCTCPLCRRFSRAYLRHLMKSNEVLGLRLATLHNLTFYLNLMADIRAEIEAGTYTTWARSWLAGWENLHQST
ncbi:MAG: tRNA guanosine(34) transglycosylase Tgt [Fidelibacterota bacterium]